MTDASRYALLLDALALISFIFYPVVLGRMMKQVKKGETTALEGFILAVFGICIYLWILSFA